MKTKETSFLKSSYLTLIYLFLYAPILVLIIYSFNDSKSRGKWGGFTLKWYKELFENEQIMNALTNTVTIAVLSAVISTVVGTLAAFIILDMKPFMRNLSMNVTYLPVLNPDIVTGLSLMLLYISLQIPLGYGSLLLSHIMFNVPYVVLAVMPKIKQLNKHLYEAALDLGASPAYAFYKIVLPEIMPGIITGALFAFTLSIDDFVVSFFTTGAGVSNLSILIYASAKKGVDPTINALSALMFVTILLLLTLINIRTKKER